MPRTALEWTLEELMALPRSGEEAKRLGHRHYFNGEPCAEGHLGPRVVNRGCRICIREKNRVRGRRFRQRHKPAVPPRGKRWTTAKFIEKAREVHGDKYDYSEAVYTYSKEPLTVICPEHGPFRVKPSNHLHNETGCPKCWEERKKQIHNDSREEFIAKATAVHGDKFDYCKVEYVNQDTKVTITCPKHGDFIQEAGSPQRGCGCPICKHETVGKANSICRPGLKLGSRTLLEKVGSTSKWRGLWRTRCECGHEEVVRSDALLARTDHCRKCGWRGGDNRERFLNDSEWANSDCFFYVADLGEGLLKPGISNNVYQRAREMHRVHEGYHFVSPKLTRCECWAIEQRILIESIQAGLDDPTDLEELGGGETEVRLEAVYPVGWYVARFNELLVRLSEVGWHDLYLFG